MYSSVYIVEALQFNQNTENCIDMQQNIFRFTESFLLTDDISHDKKSEKLIHHSQLCIKFSTFPTRLTSSSFLTFLNSLIFYLLLEILSFVAEYGHYAKRKWWKGHKIIYFHVLIFRPLMHLDFLRQLTDV